MTFKVARLGALVLAMLAPSMANAALTVTPITYDVVGLDSNNPASGPKYFPVGVRVCSDVATTGVTAAWVWDSANPDITLRAGSLSSIVIPAIAARACADVYFEVEINQIAAAFDTARRYHVVATDGSGSALSPTPREIYVEHLISQSRNSVTGARLNGVPIPAGGSVALVLGNTYTVELDSGTATQGYNQFESFINFSNAIFQIQSVTTAYSANNSPYVAGPAPTTSNKLYADACLWDSNPASPNYRACVGGDFKSGGTTITTTYVVKVIGGGGTTQTLSTLLYDFSGSSYHYNADYSASGWIANIVDPTTLTFSKAYSPSPAVAGGTSVLTFTIGNPNGAAVGGASFTDNLPLLSGSQMVVATPVSATTSGCGPAVFAPVAGASSVSFSGGSVAANSNCTVSVRVFMPSLPTSGTYGNVSGNLFIGAQDTGKNASANLGLTAVAPPTGSCGLTLASWDFSTALPNATSKRADVATATAATGAGLTAAVGAATGNPGPSWNASGFANQATLTLGNNDYLEFTVDTSKYTSITFAFDAIRSATGPASAQLYTSIDGGTTLTPQGTLVPGVAYATTMQSPTPTSTTGNTLFRIYGWNSSNAGVNATLRLDNVTVGGCQTAVPPTLTKTFLSNPIAVGGVSTLQFTLTNPGSSPLTGVKFSDSLPAGTQVAAAPAASTTCGGAPTWAPAPGETTLNFGQTAAATIAGGASCTVAVNVTATTAGPHTNVSGSVSSTEGGTNTGATGAAVATLTAVQPPVVAKMFGTSPIVVGATALMTITIKNPNPGDALSSVAISDTYPAGLVNALAPAPVNSCGGVLTAVAGGGGFILSGGSLAMGASCAITVPVTAAVAGAYANTTGAVTAAVAGAGNTASAELVVNAVNPKISLAKRISTSATGPWTPFVVVAPGTLLYYQFTAENTGDVPFDPFSVSDPTLAGTRADPATCVWQTPNLPSTLPVLPVATATVDPTATCVTGPVDSVLGGVTNTATAHGTYGGLPYKSDPATADYLGAVPGFSLMKQAGPSATGPWVPAMGVAAGANVFYKFTLANTGVLDLTGISVADPTVNTASCVFTDPLLTGQATQCVVGPIVASGASGSTTPNTANGKGSSGSSLYTTPPSTASYTIATTTADLSITKDDGTASVNAGGNTTYVITVTNHGPDEVIGATVTDSAPAGLTLGNWTCAVTNGGSGGVVTTACGANSGSGNLNATVSMKVGAVIAYTVPATISGGATGSLANTVTVATPIGTFDPVAANNSATDTNSVDLVADLSIAKTNGVGSVTAGETTTYSITVTNNGPSSATGAALADPAVAGLVKTTVTCSASPGQCATPPTVAELEGGSFALPLLASGDTYQLTVVANVTAVSGTVTNTATIAMPGGITDPVAGNNSVTDADTVQASADVSMVKTLVTAGPYTIGQAISYTLVVANAGPSTATNIQVTDTPSNLTVINVTGGGCTTLPCTIPTLASGANATVTVTATINSAGAFDNSAAAMAPESDPNPANNTDNTGNGGGTVATADVSIVKTLVTGGPYTAGQSLTYTLAVANAGPSAAASIVVADVPSNLTISNVTGGGCAALPCTLASLAAGATTTITVTTTINSAGAFDNSATAMALESDPNPANNIDTAGNGGTALAPVTNADVSVTKTDGTASVQAGANTTYTITVGNNGPSSVTGAILADPVAAGLTKTAVGCSGTPGACVTAPTIAELESGTFALPTLANGAIYQIVVTTTVTAASGTVTNTATIAPPAGVSDPVPGNNNATDTDTVITAPVLADLVITKSNGVSSIDAGASTVYTIVVANNGPGEVTGATVTDLAPFGMSINSWTCAVTNAGIGGAVTTACGAGSGVGNLTTTVTMKAGAVITYTVPATIAANMAGDLVNIATVNLPAGVSDPAPGNNSASDSDVIVSGPPAQVVPIPTLGPLALGLLMLLLGALSARFIRTERVSRDQ